MKWRGDIRQRVWFAIPTGTKLHTRAPHDTNASTHATTGSRQRKQIQRHMAVVAQIAGAELARRSCAAHAAALIRSHSE